MATPLTTKKPRTISRSLQGARLANNHHNAIAAAPRGAPFTIRASCSGVPGLIQPGTVMTSHWITMMTTAGQRRKRAAAAGEVARVTVPAAAGAG